MKTCTRCGESKPLVEFHRDARRRDGRRLTCKACRVAESRREYVANPDRAKASAARWHRANPEAAAASQRRYRDSAKWRATRAAWNERTDKRAKDRDAYARNPAPYKARARARQAITRGVDAERFEHEEIFERDGWRCGICGDPIDPALAFPDPGSASLDHVIPIALGGPHLRANTQAAHLSCNRAKGARAA